jgi:hypothetical protein
MASTFAGLSLFNSGPHRFSIARVGRLVRAPFLTPLALPVSTDEGLAIELRVLQQGRLIATTNNDLWTLIDAIRAEAEAKRTGTLVDHHGKTFASLSLITFDPARTIDRGRTFSIAYRCTYLRFG